MKIKKLKLIHFRNYQELDLNFNNNINILIGNNAQGKTSILESIYVLAITKSHKTHKDKDLIHFNESFSRIHANLENDLNIDFTISQYGKKILVNNIEQKRMSDYIGTFNVVMFAPEDLDIVKREPSIRRKFLDIEISQVSPVYMRELSQYNKVLRQRNEYLKSIFNHQTYDQSYLDTLTMQLSALGYRIFQKRKAFISKLNHYAQHIQNYLSNQCEHLELKYQPSYHFLLNDDTKEEDIFYVYKKYYDNDINKGVTQLGIHRDDFVFLVNNKDVNQYGSQGQQRTSALAIKLSLVNLIKEEKKCYPIILLDDVFSELDDKRQTQLLEYIIDKAQTFITTTSISSIKTDIIKKADVFYIENAQIKRFEEGDYNEQL